MRNEMYDYLTGLFNRQGMYHIWNENRDKYDTVQILFIDLDNFKTVNDMYGHKAGDSVLSGTARILKELSPDSSVAIRLGGDEFVLIVTGDYEKDALSGLAEQIMKRLSFEAEKDKGFEIITASIGIVRNAKTSERIDNLLSYSDAAMYFAKEKGKNTYVFFEDFEEHFRRDWEMESHAKEALEKGYFRVNYYPVHHLQSGKHLRSAVKVEWITPEGECWSRYEFERVLEKSGFLRKVDLYSFEKMCEDFHSIFEADKRKNPIAIRLSQILLDDDITERLVKICKDKDISPENIEIMFDERMLGHRSVERFIENILALSRFGFKIGIMNFGADFSSFKYINSLPISSVMFDGDYIAEDVDDESGNSVLRTLFGMARELKFLSIGQCIDSMEKAEKLINKGCEAASGNYFSKALSVSEYCDYISGLTIKDNVYSFSFKNTLRSDKEGISGEIVGQGVQFVEGISDEWGGLRFSGGEVETNLVRLPRKLFTGGSFTVSMWVKPKEIQNWISAFFIRMQKGFVSFMPTITGNLCMFRMHPDGDAPWTDSMAGALPLRQWSFVSVVYDSMNMTSRVFLNGEYVTMHTDIVDLGGASTVYLGGDSYQVSYMGDISGLMIYDSAKTSDEIRESYLEFRRGKNFHGDDEPDAEVEYQVHDPAVYYDVNTNKYHLYCTGAEGLVSDDLEHWEKLGRVVTEVPKEASDWTNSDKIWAPDIVKVGDEYRLYCSNSSWGVRQSCIFLAVSDKATGPFVPKGVVLKTDNTVPVNAIDANIIEDANTGEQYMLYGSFWGGVHLLPLDRTTGFAKDAGPNGDGVGSIMLNHEYVDFDDIDELPARIKDRRLGICLARRPLWTSGSIEGPYMIYLKKTGYYYLFVSYGSLKSDYNIRIGRSKNIKGPFLDYNGRDLADISDGNCTTGLMISAGYRWLTGVPFMGPGHNSVLVMDNDEMFLVSHIRKMQFIDEDPGPGLLQVRKLFVTPDDWIIAGAEPYARETFVIVDENVISGLYERIELRPSVPQGIAHAHPLKLFADGRLECCSIAGNWKRINDFDLELTYGPNTEFVHMEVGLDHESNKTTVLLSGLSSNGICTWAKRIGNISV